tara:strand:- start:4309 stop:4686 length:378 start_codon:yes stop_codon:yes gene_type:complete
MHGAKRSDDKMNLVHSIGQMSRGTFLLLLLTASNRFTTFARFLPRKDGTHRRHETHFRRTFMDHRSPSHQLGKMPVASNAEKEETCKQGMACVTRHGRVRITLRVPLVNTHFGKVEEQIVAEILS